MGRRGRGGADAVSVAWNPQKAAAWSVLCPRLCAVALPEVQVWVSESAPSPPRAAGAPGWSGRSAEGCPRSCGEGGSAAAPGGLSGRRGGEVPLAEPAISLFSCSPASVTFS